MQRSGSIEQLNIDNIYENGSLVSKDASIYVCMCGGLFVKIDPSSDDDL